MSFRSSSTVSQRRTQRRSREWVLCYRPLERALSSCLHGALHTLIRWWPSELISRFFRPTEPRPTGSAEPGDQSPPILRAASPPPSAPARIPHAPPARLSP